MDLVGVCGFAGVCMLATICALVKSQLYTETTENLIGTTNESLAPSKPLNVTAHDAASYHIQLHWAEPAHPNGPIEGYWVYFMHGNYTDVQTHKIKGEESHIQYNLTKLKPNTEYKIWVKAFTAKNGGDPSDAILSKTDIGGPNAPLIKNLTCQTEETIYVQWDRPTEFYNTIDLYYVYIYTAGDYSYDNVTVFTTKEDEETSYSIKNVTMNMLYGVQVGAASYSNRSKKFIRGELTEMKHLLVQPNCDKIQYMRRSNTELSAGMIAGVGCAVFAFILTLAAFIFWRKCFYAAYYYLDDNPCAPASALEWNAPPGPGDEHKGPIPVAKFGNHIAELHADSDIGFSKEYESIQVNREQLTSELSLQVDNRAKNRYLNITAFDHSRVPLVQVSAQKKTIEYINANYIDGFQWAKAYIGTQGPLPSTFDCFWRMVWEQRVTIIVMITNLVERGRRKCDMYWPKEGSETYGVIQVRLIREDVMATYTVRTLLMKHLKVEQKKPSLSEKVVYQYHYTNWPDHGTPDHPLPVLHFVKKSAAANPPGGGPIIVHCSAGVGRTGTYIVLDAMLRQIRSRNEVNVYGFLRHIRSQRNFLVQTEEQYIFIHDALLEAIESGETNISRDQLPSYVRAMQHYTTEDKMKLWKPLDYQFKYVTSFKCKDFNMVSSHKGVNIPKNRTHIVPVESARVHLTPKPGEDGTDYINATWIQGFHTLREFIISQHPLKHTIKDFWQMVWDHNAQTVVMLSIIDNQDFEVFWPVELETVDSDHYKIRLTNEQVHSNYVSRDFIMQSLQDDYELNVRMIHCSNWPHDCASLSEMFNLTNSVQEAQLGYQNGPVVVVDRFGGTEAATFCCLTTLKKQLLYENHADVYMFSKLYHNKRPGIWRSIDDYIRLHLALQAFCSTGEGCSNYCSTSNGAPNGSASHVRIRIPPEGMEAMESKLSVA